MRVPEVPSVSTLVVKHHQRSPRATQGCWAGLAITRSPPGAARAWAVGLGRPAGRRLGLSPQLLRFDPSQRLGTGEGGVSRLKAHPFFSAVQWSTLVG